MLMIKTKSDLLYYIEQDRLALHIEHLKPKWNDEVWKYEIILRKHEYYFNKEKKSLIDKILLNHYNKKHHKLSMSKFIMGGTAYLFYTRMWSQKQMGKAPVRLPGPKRRKML